MKSAQQKPAPGLVDEAQPLSRQPFISALLADFAAGLTYEAIPERVRERAKHLILDAVGIAFASTGWEFAHKTLTAMQGLAGAGEVSVIGFPARLPLRDAVLVNGVLVHGLDYDDTHMAGIIHTTASSFPCALGMAEHTRAHGRDLLTAYVLGVEAGARIAIAAKGGFHQSGFHPTGLVGAFACALIAGRLFGCNAEQLAMAQGVALSTAAGSQEFLEDGAWTKRMHPGWAGVAGITAAALARQGFVGPARAYEGRFGLYNIYMGASQDRAELKLATAGLGETWEIERVGVKPFPACHFTHGCADAALELVRKHRIKPAEIKKITVLVPSDVVIDVICEPEARKRRPVSDYDAKFSVQYIVAACLVRGKFGLAELEPDALSDPEILALADKVEYAPDPDSPFPRAYSGEVIVTTAKGRTYRHREHVNRGADDRPLSNEEVVAKFMENAELAVAPRRAEAIRDLILSLDDRDAREIAAGLGG